MNMPRPRLSAGVATFALLSALALPGGQTIGAGPTVIKVGDQYVAAKPVDGGIAIRTAPTPDGIATAIKHQVWKDGGGLGEVRAPGVAYSAGRYDIYWYKSNGCLFGSYQPDMMAGWDPTLYVDGPGSNSFVLTNGDIGRSPPSGNRFPTMYHAVAKGTPYSWSARYWYTGSAVWWSKTTYRRADVPGNTADVGYSLKFFE